MSIQTPDRRADNFAPWRSVYPTDSVGKQLAYSLEEPLQPSHHPFLRAIGQDGPEPGWWIVDLGFVLAAAVAVVVRGYGVESGTGALAWGLALDAMALQVAIIIFILYARFEARRYPDGVKALGEVSVRSLRRAALAGDDELVPAVALPGAYGADVALPAGGAETLTVLPPEWRLLRAGRILGGVGLGLTVLWGVLSWLTDHSSSGFPWDAVFFPVLLFLMFLWMLIHTIRQSRAFTVTVDADGLRWGRKMAPWSEARGWYVFSLYPMRTRWTHRDTVYALVGRHASLAWITYSPTIGANDPGVRLARIVQAQLQTVGTGGSPLPLRDLTPGAITISYDVGPRLFWWGTWRLVAANDHTMGGSSLPRLPVALLTLALSVVVLLGAIFTPNFQLWYYGRQLTQLEASHTAIHDPLTANTLGWTTAPVYGSHKTFVFTPQGYVYPAQDCCGGSSLVARPVGDGLAEMTIRQQETDKNGEAGLIVRASEKVALAFTISPAGYWSLYRLKSGNNGPLSDEDYLQSDGRFAVFGLGRVQPIHQGLDTTNRLAVLMRGSSYTFFINGQYVGGYTSDDFAQSGQVGVYVDLANGPVTFSDLLIAPA